MVPFAPDDFFSVFADYNSRVWLVQFVLAGVAVASIALAWRPGGIPRHIMVVLRLLWIWMGAALQGIPIQPHQRSGCHVLP